MPRYPAFFALFLVFSALCGPASAQLARGLGPGLPSLPGDVGRLPDRLGSTVRELRNADLRGDIRLAELRRVQIRELLRTQPLRVDLDPVGELVLRSEFLVLAPDDATLAAVRQAGFSVSAAPQDDGLLDMPLVVLRDLRPRSAREAMRALQRAAPQAEFAFQHVYLPSGSARAAPALAPTSSAPTGPLRVGLIDGGVDASHPALASLTVHRHGCNGASPPQAHGTAVAVRLSGGATGQLFAADLWCGDAVGRATLGLVQALGWLAREKVAVVNVSLVGPANPVLARAIAAMQARGHVIIAAVGNDGPAAPPLFPAAYPGVIAVAAVDERLRVLPESGSGPHVDFAAVGVVGERRGLRGTSFAAPVVARVAATIAREPQPDAASRVQLALASRAKDLGRPGRDTRYGEGVVVP